MSAKVLTNALASKPLFNGISKVVSAVTGTSMHNFEFNESLPMSTTKETLIALVVYYTVIFGGREVMRNRPAFKFDFIFKVHNFMLTAISGLLLALFLEQIVPTLASKGLFSAVCEAESGWSQPLVLLYYLNYLTKYVEFIDTCFLFLRKKPLSFLHTYHHGATALLCFLQMQGHTAVSWVPITLNLSVHCLMYWYYFQSSRGIKIWWKKYITVLQIAQFVIDLVFIYFSTWNIIIDRHWPQIPHSGACGGSDLAASSGAIILTSYLFLFLEFYRRTYKKPIRAPKMSEVTDFAMELPSPGANLMSEKHLPSHVVSPVNGRPTGLQTLQRVNANLAKRSEGAMPLHFSGKD